MQESEEREDVHRVDLFWYFENKLAAMLFQLLHFYPIFLSLARFKTHARTHTLAHTPAC